MTRRQTTSRPRPPPPRRRCAPATPGRRRRPRRAAPDGRIDRPGADGRGHRPPGTPHGSTSAPSPSPPPSCWPVPSGWWWPRNPVHSALMLVMTLFGIAVLFVLQRDPLPGRRAGDRLRRGHRGAVPVRDHVPRRRPRGERGLRAAARPAPAGRRVGRPRHRPAFCCWARSRSGPPGAPHVAGTDSGAQSNVALLGRSVYTTYLFPFEATAALLVIAVVGAVVLARRPPVDRPSCGTSISEGTPRPSWAPKWMVRPAVAVSPARGRRRPLPVPGPPPHRCRPPAGRDLERNEESAR